ncbi:Adhesion G-protein coupled receptor G4 [Bulinus truncatus]|nr:Adhesion G-protein coupled receptor G4 [Bulinus truncatus]
MTCKETSCIGTLLRHARFQESCSGGPPPLLADLEQFGAKADIEGQHCFRYVTPNVAMELWNLNSYNDVVIGFGATETSSWLEPLEEPRIVTIKNRTWSEQNLPGFDVAIELPESLIKDTIRYSQRGTDTPLRLTMFLYRKTSAFLPSNMAETPSGEVNSAIISASLAGRKIRDLQERVRLVFKPFKVANNREEETKCVFWDTETYANPTWSPDGCTYNGTLNGRDVCLCDHLTNFAILMDFYGDEKAISSDNETSLSVLTLIGTSLSIFGLAITIITFLAFKKLRQGRAQQTLFNMAVALLCFQTTFLVGVKQTSIKSVCMTVSVLLHYFILVSFAWMLIEAVLQYLTFVKVLGTYISKYTLKTVLFAWGFPLIPVVAVLATDYNLYYGRANYCWMSVHAFYYAFALPVGIIIVFNSIMFFIIIVSLITRPKGLRSNQSNNKTRETNLKATFTIFVLLGLTWLFGYFAIEDARVVFQYVFTILSSLQGFLIFILMVVRRKQVRELWKAACCDRRQAHRSQQKKQLSPASSNSMSSNNSLSNSSRTLPSFINHAYSGGSLVLKPGLRRENSVSI